jgi:glycosyltransferase involved in cell wall biosynthesis
VKRIVIHDHTPGDRPRLRGISAAIKDGVHRLGIFSASTYVAVSDYIHERLRSNARVAATRCTVVTNGIRMFACDESRKAGVRRNLGIPDDAVLIVLVSRATYYKGLDFAVKCVADLFRGDEPLRTKVFAVHCGDGPDLEAFRQLTEDLSLSGNFRFLGRRDDVRDILCAADVAFHPSHGEAMSIAVLEFMAAGLAVLTSDLPSVCAAIQPGQTGLTYRHDDLADAADALGMLVRRADIRRSLGTAARSACSQRFSLETMNRTFLERVAPAL